MSVPNPLITYMLNPSGQSWLLLAFPDGSDDDALRMFEEDTTDQRPGDAGVLRIALAGPAYEGAAVLAPGAGAAWPRTCARFRRCIGVEDNLLGRTLCRSRPQEVVCRLLQEP